MGCSRLYTKNHPPHHSIHRNTHIHVKPPVVQGDAGSSTPKKNNQNQPNKKKTYQQVTIHNTLPSQENTVCTSSSTKRLAEKTKNGGQAERNCTLQKTKRKKEKKETATLSHLPQSSFLAFRLCQYAMYLFIVPGLTPLHAFLPSFLRKTFIPQRLTRKLCYKREGRLTKKQTSARARLRFLRNYR